MLPEEFDHSSPFGVSEEAKQQNRDAVIEILEKARAYVVCAIIDDQVLTAVNGPTNDCMTALASSTEYLMKKFGVPTLQEVLGGMIVESMLDEAKEQTKQ